MIIRSAGQIGPSPGIGLPSPRPRGVSQAAPGFGPYGGFQGARRRIRGGEKAWSPADLASTLTYWDFRVNRTITSAPDIDSVSAVSGDTVPTLTAGANKPHATSEGAEFAAGVTDQFTGASAAATWGQLNREGGSIVMLLTNEAAAEEAFFGTSIRSTSFDGVNLGKDASGNLLFRLCTPSGFGASLDFSGFAQSTAMRAIEVHWSVSEAVMLVDGVQVASTSSVTLGTSNPLFTTRIGLSPNGASFPLAGVIGALAVNYGTPLSASNQANLRNFINAEWDRLAVPEPTMLLDSTSGVTHSGGSVTQWVDSVNSNTFTNVSAPGFIASDSEFNGEPSISFDGVDDSLRDSASVLPTMTGGRSTLTIVARDGDPTKTQQVLVGARTPSLDTFRRWLTTGVGIFDGGNSRQTTEAPPTNTYVYTVVRDTDADVARLYLDGVHRATVDLTTNNAWHNTSIGIGSNGIASGGFFEGKIARVELYDEVLSTPAIAAKDAALLARFRP